MGLKPKMVGNWAITSNFELNNLELNKVDNYYFFALFQPHCPSTLLWASLNYLYIYTVKSFGR